MKKHIILALVSTGVLNISNALASDGTITISGRLVESSCLISIDSDISGTSSVILPVISRTLLASAGTTAGATPFTMTLSGCPSETSVRAYFEPKNVDMSTGYLINQASTETPASNVQVQIADGTTLDAIDLRNNGNNNYIPISGGIASLSYAAQYIAVGGPASSGDVESQLIYTLEYK